jgi:hypothetical protein
MGEELVDWSGDPKLDAAADVANKAISRALEKALPEVIALCGEKDAHIAMLMVLVGRMKKLIKVAPTVQGRQKLASLIATEIEMLQAASGGRGRA